MLKAVPVFDNISECKEKCFQHVNRM